jgi:hypothetical protein
MRRYARGWTPRPTGFNHPSLRTISSHIRALRCLQGPEGKGSAEMPTLHTLLRSACSRGRPSMECRMSVTGVWIRQPTRGRIAADRRSRRVVADRVAAVVSCWMMGGWFQAAGVSFGGVMGEGLLAGSGRSRRISSWSMPSRSISPAAGTMAAKTITSGPSSLITFDVPYSHNRQSRHQTGRRRICGCRGVGRRARRRRGDRRRWRGRSTTRRTGPSRRGPRLRSWGWVPGRVFRRRTRYVEQGLWGQPSPEPANAWRSQCGKHARARRPTRGHVHAGGV